MKMFTIFNKRDENEAHHSKSITQIQKTCTAKSHFYPDCFVEKSEYMESRREHADKMAA